MKRFKINTRDHFRHLWPSIFVTVLLPAILYFLSMYKKGYYDFNTALWAGGIGFLGYFIPVVLIHLRYYYMNKNDFFQYNDSTGKAIYQKGKKEINFSIGDIDKITVFKSRSLSENRTPILVWDYYNYAVIELKDKQVIKLSSLLVSELDKVVMFDNIELEKTLYAWMN